MTDTQRDQWPYSHKTKCLSNLILLVILSPCIWCFFQQARGPTEEERRASIQAYVRDCVERTGRLFNNLDCSHCAGGYEDPYSAGAVETVSECCHQCWQAEFDRTHSEPERDTYNPVRWDYP